MSRFKVLALFVSCFMASLAHAEEPEDRNFGGPLLGGHIVLGQAQKVGEGSPGTAYLVGADLVYGIKRDTWNRIELGLELNTGRADFTDKTSLGNLEARVDLGLVALVKAGYGYSLGGHAFGNLRLGLGMAQGKYSGNLVGKSIDGGSKMGVAGVVGWDAMFPASDRLDFVFGADFYFFNFTFNNIPNESFQLNMPSLYLGARARL